jgi:DNA-binding MarR family transcriptional regulator
MSIGEIPDDPLSRFSLAIFRVNGLLMRDGDRVTRAIGQSSARWQVLGRVGYMPQTVAEMARDMGHARQSVQRVADELVKEGLTVYKDKPTDKRTKLLELTERGAEVLAAIYSLSETRTQQLMTKLDADVLVEAAYLLESIGDILEADEQEGLQPAKHE